MKRLLPGSIVGRSVVAAVAIMGSASMLQATPYATSLTNNAGVVSFRLNQATSTNDSIIVISSGGSVTNTLQLPGANTFPAGLLTTNLGIAAGTFQVQIKHIGNGSVSPISAGLTPGSPAAANANIRGIVANTNPVSPYFGRVYVSVGSRATLVQDGIYAYNADLTDAIGQGSVAKQGGYTFNSSGFSPYKLTLDSSGNVIVGDASLTTGNLISLDPNLNTFSYILKPIVGASATPVGTNNNHGAVDTGVFIGSGANLTLYTMDQTYQSDPTSGNETERHSVWKYVIGTNSLPYTNAPDSKVMTPFLNGFNSQNEGIQIGYGGRYLYCNQRRANPPQYSLYICDLQNPIDPASYGAASPGGMFWNSQDTSLNAGYSDDVSRDMNQFTLSADGRWLAGIIAAGSAAITAPDGSTFTTDANEIQLYPLTNGIPNIAARVIYKTGGAANGRDIAFDAANNLILGSSGTGTIQAFDIGESPTATTGSDGTFSLTVPATQVSVAATTPAAYEQGVVPGVFTVTRANGDLSSPLTVKFKLSGTAAYTNHYSLSGAGVTSNSVIIPAGLTSATVNVVPVDDSIPQLTETVVLTLQASGGYSLGFPLASTVSIIDNETPQLRVVSLSTNISQGVTNDYAQILIRRYGDTNISLNLTSSDFAFGGTAVLGTDYYLANVPISIPAGQVDTTVKLLYPGLSGSTGVGTRTIILTNVADTGYTVSNNVASTVLTLKNYAAGTVLYSDNFESDPVGTNWNLIPVFYTNASPDYSIIYNFDYVGSGYPTAPNSTGGETRGLLMTVNKNNGVAGALNLYLKNRNFGSNYAFRFDMLLIKNGAGNVQSQNENALFGINHDGLHTNWIRNQVPGSGVPTVPDGLWFDVGADGNNSSGAFTDFGAWSAPVYTNGGGVVGPTNFLFRSHSTLTQVFKNPPYDGGTATGGTVSVSAVSPAPTWSTVEVSQVGQIVTFKINNSTVLSFTNVSYVTNVAPVTNGTIMLGYNDPWDDVGDNSPGNGEGLVIYDNVKVVQLAPPVFTTQPTNFVAAVGATATFSAAASTGTGVTNYQWQLNGTNIVGATSATYSFTATNSSFGNYTVSAYDGAYYTYSSVATLRPPAFTITGQPANAIAVVGGSPTFAVTAPTFSGATNYQWLVYGTNVTGATARTLTLTNVQLFSFGAPYTVIVGDGFTTVTSTPSATVVAGSRPSLSTPARVGNNLVYTYPTQVGPNYVVEFKTNLLSATWVPVKTNAGTGAAISVTNAINLSTNSAAYYRVRLQ